MSTANQIFIVSGRLVGPGRRPRRGRRRWRRQPPRRAREADPAARLARVDDLDAAARVPRGDLRGGLARGLGGPRDPTGDVDRDDVLARPRPAARTPRGSRRSTAATWSAARSPPQLLVERVEVRHVRLALAVAVVDVEATSWMSLPAQLARRVVRGVGDDRDLGHAGSLRERAGRATGWQMRAGCPPRSSPAPPGWSVAVAAALVARGEGCGWSCRRGRRPGARGPRRRGRRGRRHRPPGGPEGAEGC